VPWATPVDLGQYNGSLITSTLRTLTRQGLTSGSGSVSSGSLVVSTRAPIGYVAQTTSQLAFNQGCRGLTPLRVLDIRYYRYVLGSINAGLQADGQGSTFVELSTHALASTLVPLPPPAAQCAIADFLEGETSRIDALIVKKRRVVELAKQRFLLVAHSLTAADAGRPLRRFVSAVQTGTTPPAVELASLLGGDLPWFSPGDVAELLALRSADRHLGSQAVREGWCPLFPADSTLIVGIGATAGRVAHLDEMATGNQQITCISSAKGIRPRFLSWQLFSRGDEIRMLAPHTTLPIISNEFLRSLPVSMPPESVQDEVIKILDSLARSVNQATRTLDKQTSLLRERRQALITAAVTGELDVPGVVA